MIEDIRNLLADYHHQDGIINGTSYHTAAVLVPLLEIDDELHTLFILRTEDMGPHSGQMGFPGGMAEESDRGDLQNTALREAGEEIGIDTGDVTVLGRLSDLVTWTSEIIVRPYVGVFNGSRQFKPDPTEVQSIHITSLRSMTENVIYEENDFMLPPPVFPVDGLPVWGLSARIVTEFFEVVGSVFGSGLETK
jgi:8-oxo-dGTP pyrophosphatase MutT (NUDIX family)